MFEYISPGSVRSRLEGWNDERGKKRKKGIGSKARRGKNETAQRFIGKGNREYASPFRSAAVARGLVRYDCTVCSLAAIAATIARKG